jgi:hypothetical protein
MRSNELPQKRHLLAGNLLAAVAPRFPHGHSMPEKKAERKSFVLLFSAHLAPHRCGWRIRIARRQQ